MSIFAHKEMVLLERFSRCDKKQRRARQEIAAHILLIGKAERKFSGVKRFIGSG